MSVGIVTVTVCPRRSTASVLRRSSRYALAVAVDVRYHDGPVRKACKVYIKTTWDETLLGFCAALNKYLPSQRRGLLKTRLIARTRKEILFTGTRSAATDSRNRVSNLFLESVPPVYVACPSSSRR